MFTRLLVLFLVCLAGAATAEPAFTDAECLDCHGIESYAVPTGEHGEAGMRPLGLNVSAWRDSVHGDLKCVTCHDDVRELPHRKTGLERPDCVQCHLETAERKAAEQAQRKRQTRAARREKEKPSFVINTERYTRSVHADGKADNADCATCHTAHYVYPSDDPRASTFREYSPTLCGACHEKALAAWSDSLHAAALRRPWKGDSATCSDCHNAHEIAPKEQLATQRRVTKNCGDCHQHEVASYMMTTHGQLAWLGNAKVPRCSDCHEGHATVGIDDPRSPVSEERRLDTCRECHETAGPGIVSYKAHGNTNNFDRYPLMFITGKFMVGIVILVLIFFYTHSMLWFYREYKTRVLGTTKVDGVTVRYRIKPPKKHSDRHFQRFPWYWRLNHWALALSVMTLVMTGMAVMYPDTDWAMRVVAAVGGPAAFGIIHRTAGVVFLLAVLGHLVAVLARVLRDPNFEWFGPDSLLPRKKDWEDMKAQFRWFFGKGEQPRFDRFTYWEKFDYWAVYWGAFVIGTSGVILWASPTLLEFLPGWVFNIASIAHGVEAFLAVTTLFVVHFFNNHFRPAKFPLDTVMFSGSWDLEEFKEERPLEYERLVASGELEKHLVKPPSKLANVIYHILGFTLLGIGISLLVMVLIGFFERGLV